MNRTKAKASASRRCLFVFFFALSILDGNSRLSSVRQCGAHDMPQSGVDTRSIPGVIHTHGTWRMANH